MSDLIFTLTLAVLAVAALSILYRVLPMRELPGLRPGFTLFPKYSFSIEDLESLKRNLYMEGFVESGQNQYSRGSYFGDFKASWAKLRIDVDGFNGRATLKSPLVVIAFDTGDLWDIASKLRAG